MALRRASQIGASACQIFVKNNMQWRGKPFTAAALQLWESEVKAQKLLAVFGHTGYLINIAGPESDARRQSIASLIQEVELAASLGLPFLVLHPGAHLGLGEEAGLRQAVSGLDEVFAATRTLKVQIALENTAGQGSCLGNRFEHLAEIFDAVKTPKRLAVCIDTAHLFAAGYDIRSRQGWNRTVNLVDNLIGLNQVVAFHLNDSKTDLGSRVDRHEHIGQGKIGKEAFRHIVNDLRFKNTPGCLETPKSDDLHEDLENLTVLRSLLRGRKKMKKAGPVVV